MITFANSLSFHEYLGKIGHSLSNRYKPHDIIDTFLKVDLKMCSFRFEEISKEKNNPKNETECKVTKR